MNYLLHIVNGPQQGKQFPLRSRVSSIGRGRENEVVLRDEEASRKHAEIYIENDLVSISDLGSSNGTIKDEVRIKTAELANGDQFTIGKTTLLLLVESDSMPAVEPVDEEAGRTQKSLPEDSGEIEFSDPHSISHSFSTEEVQTVQNNLQFLYDAALATSRSGESKAMCLRLLSLIFDWIAADRGCILLRDTEDGRLKPEAIKYRSNFSRRRKLTVSQSIVNYVTEKGAGVLTHDAASDSRWSREGNIVEGVKEVICVPIQGQKRLYGVIYVDRITAANDAATDRQRFNIDQLKLIVAIAHQAAVAFESEGYYAEIVKSERHTAIGQTLSSLSHHIKNILQSINGGAHLVEKGLELENLSAIESGWQIVQGNQQRLSNLMLDMLHFSKPKTPARKWCAIDELIAVAIRKQNELANRQGVELIADAVPDPRLVSIDPVTMEAAIENVFVHSIPILAPIEHGTIVVSVRFDEKDMVIQFEDDFQSASDAELEQIFLPFGFESEDKVRGISLAVSHKIVNEHDGEMEVARNDKGLSFKMTLPLVGKK